MPGSVLFALTAIINVVTLLVVLFLGQCGFATHKQLQSSSVGHDVGSGSAFVVDNDHGF